MNRKFFALMILVGLTAFFPLSAASTGKELVTTVWKLVQHHKWDVLKNKMDRHFSSINVVATLSNRRQEIAFLKSLKIQTIQVDVLKVQLYGEKVMAVQYQLSAVLQEAPGLVFPLARMSIFQKKEGKWLWKSDADLNTFLVEAE